MQIKMKYAQTKLLYANLELNFSIAHKTIHDTFFRMAKDTTVNFFWYDYLTNSFQTCPTNDHIIYINLLQSKIVQTNTFTEVLHKYYYIYQQQLVHQQKSK